MTRTYDALRALPDGALTQAEVAVLLDHIITIEARNTVLAARFEAYREAASKRTDTAE
ncbi:MAG: hypothetical protein P8N02_16110 [Actinomycetota bacterium]|jgi:hypothetical protein|nr:hypothetical protein [Actinomycetota bacterium]